MRISSVFRTLLLSASAALLAASAMAQAPSHILPGGGWYMDPSVHGMLDTFQIRRIEGCNEPGGLTEITSSDEPGVNAPYWCGPAPFCLTTPAVAAGERCSILPYSTRNPRYSAAGAPGANGVRNPTDLRCDNTGLAPINSRCPVIPTAAISLNNSTNLTVTTGTRVTLRVTTTNARPEWGGSATLSCSGANAGRSPFNTTNLSSFLNASNVQVGNNTLPTAGTMTCTLTVTNWRGTVTATARVVVNNPPSSGGGGGGGGNPPEPVLGSCPALAVQRLNPTTGASNYRGIALGNGVVDNGCPVNLGPLGATANGVTVNVTPQNLGSTCNIFVVRFRCTNGTWSRSGGGYVSFNYLD
ncbi:hypothetical protein [Hydrogenophaga sp. NFH-34]|uniref:hypothetical protein n=1 Tax=Hydrogenophaga sp. NFH-34 TaxID=2744446 RepID=UPI001F458EDE|nr:hypothetical protein [Hydrogenophaga sp. NFH-34]